MSFFTGKHNSLNGRAFAIVTLSDIYVTSSGMFACLQGLLLRFASFDTVVQVMLIVTLIRDCYKIFSRVFAEELSIITSFELTDSVV